MNEKWLTVAEVAKMAGKPGGNFTISTIHYWIKKGLNGKKLPARRVGLLYYISELDWLRFYYEVVLRHVETA